MKKNFIEIVKEKNIGSEELYDKHLQKAGLFLRDKEELIFSVNARQKAQGIGGSSKLMAAIGAFTMTLFFFWKPKIIFMMSDKSLIIVRDKNIGSQTSKINLSAIMAISLDEAWRENKVWIKFGTVAGSFRILVPKNDAQTILEKVE